ncbi:MAG TPA: efflux transporter periplasmic adaptor subunit, partial [Casimicrobiaceae bacterium]
AVWIYDPATQTVALRRVELDAFREDGALVSSGVKDGEWIVAAGVHKLRAGQTVKPWESGDVPVATASAKPKA